MRKIVFVLLVVILGALETGSALADPPCGGLDKAPYWCAFIRPNVYQRVADGIPFVWIRSESSSTASVLYTVYPSVGASMVTVGGQESDGVQEWWQVQSYPDGSAIGWVERASLAEVEPPAAAENMSNPSPEVEAGWQTPFVAHVRPGISAVWVRAQPSSTNMDIEYELHPLETVQVIGSPRFDGYQWWWQIHTTVRYNLVQGWVEQASVTPGA